MLKIVFRFLVLAALCGALAYVNAFGIEPSPYCPSCGTPFVCCKVTMNGVYGSVPPSECCTTYGCGDSSR